MVERRLSRFFLTQRLTLGIEGVDAVSGTAVPGSCNRTQSLCPSNNYILIMGCKLYSLVNFNRIAQASLH